jgi:hypothetical protein
MRRTACERRAPPSRWPVDFGVPAEMGMPATWTPGAERHELDWARTAEALVSRSVTSGSARIAAQTGQRHATAAALMHNRNYVLLICLSGLAA